MAPGDLKSRIEAMNGQPMRNSLSTLEKKEVGISTAVGILSASLDKAQDAEKDPNCKGSAGKNAREEESGAGIPPTIKETEIPHAIQTLTAPFDESMSTKGNVVLEDVIEGIEAQSVSGDGYYLIEKPAVELDASADVMYRRFVRLTGYPDGEAVERFARACKSEKISPEEIIFLDLETTGLNMTPVFLIGTMECTSNGLTFRQYFARDYSEETGIVSAFAHRLKDARMVVTFNGKCFDMPFLANRATAKGIKLPVPEFHLDMLHEARRIYKRDLPNCRLQTLEQMVCGRSREDDIPGAEIPRAYDDFVRTGDACKIAQILTHNLHDLLTMADLMHRMWYRD